MIKFIFSMLIIACTLITTVFAQTKATFIIRNSSSLSRTNEIVALDWKSVLKKYPSIDTLNFKIVDSKSQKEIPYQLEYKGEKKVQNLLLQISTPPKGEILLQLKAGKSQKITTKTYGRFVPERKDDFAWENDLIAFRAYGKALENTPKENAYGFDVWAKRTDKLVINQRYKVGEYHIDHGDGLDYYHVGYTLGAGNIAPFVNDTIRYPKNYTSYKVLDNGPLRTTFQLMFDEWNVAGQTVKSIKTISLDAGSQLNRIEANYSWNGSKTMSAVIGIIKRSEPGVVVFDEKQGITAYWEPQHGPDGIIGVGTILAGTSDKTLVTKEQFLTQTTVVNDTPYIYYTGAAWNKAGKIINAEAWLKYLQNFKQKLTEPLQIKVQ